MFFASLTPPRRWVLVQRTARAPSCPLPGHPATGFADQLRRSYLEAPTGCTSGRGDLHQRRALRPAAVLGKGATRVERARPDYTPNIVRVARGPFAPAAQDATDIVGVGGRGDEQLCIRVPGMLGDLLSRPPLHDPPCVHHQY